MALDITKAQLSQGCEIPFEIGAAIPPQTVLGETITFDPVSLQGVMCAAQDSVALRGSLATIAHGACARCLAPASADIALDFNEVFRRDAQEDDEAFPFTGHEVDTDRLALTLVMLNLPMRFLCQEDCTAVDAYVTDADSSCHSEAPTQRPFEALQQLLTKDEEV